MKHIITYVCVCVCDDGYRYLVLISINIMNGTIKLYAIIHVQLNNRKTHWNFYQAGVRLFSLEFEVWAT